MDEKKGDKLDNIIPLQVIWGFLNNFVKKQA